VGDVARANLRASDLALPAEGGLDESAFNVGTGVGTSVNRLADILEEVSGRSGGRTFRAARKGELRHSTLDISRFREWGWSPQVSLKEGLRETFEWIAGEAGTGAASAGSVAEGKGSP
jgi:UDP-glucose 4-epimerase